MPPTKRKAAQQTLEGDSSLEGGKKLKLESQDNKSSSMSKARVSRQKGSNKTAQAPDFTTEAHKQWNENFKQRLPDAARRKDPCQSKWPVQLDHCFGRIILDKIIGEDTPWTAKLKGPAIRNMSEDQAKQCNDLAEAILAGKVSLVELDELSLAVRGKKSKAKWLSHF